MQSIGVDYQWYRWWRVCQKQTLQEFGGACGPTHAAAYQETGVAGQNAPDQIRRIGMNPSFRIPGEGEVNHFGELARGDGINLLRRCQCHQPGPDPHRCLAGKEGGSHVAPRPGHDQDMTEGAFVGVEGAAG